MVNSSLYNRLFHSSQKGGKKLSLGVNFINILLQKKDLLVLIFANLIVQLGITYYVFLRTPASNKNKLIIVLSLFAIILVIGLVPMPSWLKFILFCVFSVLQGLFLSGIKTIANQDMIRAAIVGALSIFALMFAFGLGLLTFGVALSGRIGLFLFLSLLLLIIVEIVSIFTGTLPVTKRIFAFFGLVLFSLYVIYDTNKILQRNYAGDFITASMDYYLDIINIMLDVLTLQNNS